MNYVPHADPAALRVRDLAEWGRIAESLLQTGGISAPPTPTNLIGVFDPGSRVLIQQRLRALAPEGKQRRELLKLAEFVRHAGMTWAGAEQLQRNRLLTRLALRIAIDDDRVVAIEPRPDLAGSAATRQPISVPGGSDGIRTRDLRLDRPTC